MVSTQSTRLGQCRSPSLHANPDPASTTRFSPTQPQPSSAHAVAPSVHGSEAQLVRIRTRTDPARRFRRRPSVARRPSRRTLATTTFLTNRAGATTTFALQRTGAHRRRLASGTHMYRSTSSTTVPGAATTSAGSRGETPKPLPTPGRTAVVTCPRKPFATPLPTDPTARPSSPLMGSSRISRPTPSAPLR